MKIIKTTGTVEAGCFYSLNKSLFVLDIKINDGRLKSEEHDFIVSDFVNIDGSMLVSIIGENHTYNVTLVAESELDLFALRWHRLFDVIDEDTVKVVFVHIADITNVSEIERGSLKASAVIDTFAIPRLS